MGKQRGDSLFFLFLRPDSLYLQMLKLLKKAMRTLLVNTLNLLGFLKNIV